MSYIFSGGLTVVESDLKALRSFYQFYLSWCVLVCFVTKILFDNTQKMGCVGRCELQGKRKGSWPIIHLWCFLGQKQTLIHHHGNKGTFLSWHLGCQLRCSWYFHMLSYAIMKCCYVQFMGQISGNVTWVKTTEVYLEMKQSKTSYKLHQNYLMIFKSSLGLKTSSLASQVLQCSATSVKCTRGICSKKHAGWFTQQIILTDSILNGKCGSIPTALYCCTSMAFRPSLCLTCIDSALSSGQKWTG